MKKYIKILTTLSLGVFVTACGTTTVGGGGETSLSVQTKQVALSQDARSIDVDLFLENNYKKDIGVKLDNLAIDTVKGCIIESSEFSQNPVVFEENTGANVHAKVNFKESCNPSSFFVKGNLVLTLGENSNEVFFRSQEQKVNISYDNNSTVVNGASTTKLLPIYKFFNAPKDIIIDSENQSYPFKIQLLDNNYRVIAGKTVNILANYNIEYGELSSYSVTTDKNGFANFSLKSPDSIENLIGRSFSLTMYNEDGRSKIEQSIGFKFGISSSYNETNTSTETNSSDTINYGIKFSLEEEETMKFYLEDKKSIQITLIDKDTGKNISDDKVISLKVSSKQDDLLKLFDANENTVPSASITYTKKNNVNIYVQTFQKSGLANIDVEVEYTNEEGSTREIKKTYSTIILSGPPTAFSINDAGVSYNFDTKWFEHKYLISAVDKYSNHVNISPTIYVNAMTDFVRDNNGTRLLYGKFGELKGNLIADANNKAHLEVTKDIFQNIDYNTDYALIFGDVNSYEALGKWDLNQDLSSNSALYFSDTYNGENYNGLGFAVGHNYMEEICSSSYREWHLKIDSTDGKYTLDEEGKTAVTVKYPAQYLYGKLGAISVNFLGKNPKTEEILKSGEVYFDVWNNVEGLKGATYTVPKGSGTLPYTHVGYIDTGTGDSFVLKNSHFSCTVEVNNVASINFKSENTLIKNSSECGGMGETSYIEYDVTALPDTDGSITFSDCYVNGIPSF